MEFYDSSPVIVANEAEMHAAFPAWQAVAEEPLLVDVPIFGSGILTYEKWDVADDLGTKYNDLNVQIEYGQFPHLQLNGLTVEHLARLHSLIGDITYDLALRNISRPLLIGQNSTWKFGLHRFPRAFHEALAGLETAAITTVSSRWATSEQMESDDVDEEFCAELLHELVGLARTANSELKELFFVGEI